MLTTGQLETNRECSEAWASWTEWPLGAVWRHNYLRPATGVWPMRWARACWGASGAWRQGWRRHKQGTKAPRMWRPAVAFVRRHSSSTSLERHPSGCNALKPQYFEKSMFCFVVTLGSFCQNYHCHRMYTHKSSTYYRSKILYIVIHIVFEYIHHHHLCQHKHTYDWPRAILTRVVGRERRTGEEEAEHQLLGNKCTCTILQCHHPSIPPFYTTMLCPSIQ